MSALHIVKITPSLIHLTCDDCHSPALSPVMISIETLELDRDPITFRCKRCFKEGRDNRCSITIRELGYRILDALGLNNYPGAGQVIVWDGMNWIAQAPSQFDPYISREWDEAIQRWNDDGGQIHQRVDTAASEARVVWDYSVAVNGSTVVWAHSHTEMAGVVQGISYKIDQELIEKLEGLSRGFST